MELQPTVQEARAYSYTALDDALRQHDQNIATYQEIINKEQERIEWLRRVIKLKQELEDGNDSV